MYKKTISKSLGLLIALLVTIAIVIISYASYITYAANQRTISTLSEISHQNQTIFSLELGRDAKIIENAASYIEKLGYASFESVKICAGESPFSISTLVETKVVPQMATVIKAKNII